MPPDSPGVSCAADFIARALLSWGIKYLPGLSSKALSPLVRSLEREGIRFIEVRHENTAAFMASAHAKLTGKVGVCLAGSGFGFTNMLTGLYDAALDGVPLLVIQVLETRENPHCFVPFAAFSREVPASELAKALPNAIQAAYLQKGVAHLAIHREELAAPMKPCSIPLPELAPAAPRSNPRILSRKCGEELLFHLAGSQFGLQENAILSLECEEGICTIGQHFQADRHCCLLSERLQGPGFAFAGALAAKLEHPERQVICLTSAEALNRGLADFITSVRYQLAFPTLVFVREGVHPNFAAFAQSCGGMGLQIRDIATLEGALREFLRLNQPSLIEVFL